jgi:hypothetical protein
MWCNYQTAPSLETILNDDSDGPFSRQKFVEFLTNRHCLEPLEFIMDSKSYEKLYLQPSHNHEELEALWHNIVVTYLRLDSPKELNIPCEMREKLHDGGLPHPSELRPTMDIAKELIKDNAYMAFIQQQLDPNRSSKAISTTQCPSSSLSSWLSSNLNSTNSSDITSISPSRSSSPLQVGTPPPAHETVHDDIPHDDKRLSNVRMVSPPASPVATSDLCRACNSLDDMTTTSGAKAHWRKMSMWKWRRNEKPLTTENN